MSISRMKHSDRIKLAHKALSGIALGDAFGESFFGKPEDIIPHLEQRTIPISSWEFTDDTVMSLAVFEQLEQHGAIVQDELALLFAKNEHIDPYRGYGATARRILRQIQEGEPWRKLSYEVFEGMGSMGNGASMRVGSIGAYWQDELRKVKEQARLSAEITHAHAEGIAGAIAVATATAIATSLSPGEYLAANDFLDQVCSCTPDSDTRSKIAKAKTVGLDYHIDTVRSILGDGTKILAQDTVPFAIWCAAHHLHDFEEALWKAVSILGDRDTICAIVGGIVIMSAPAETIPEAWKKSVEDMHSSPFRNVPTA